MVIYIVNGNFMIWVLSLWWMTILLTTDMGTEPAMRLWLSILAMEQTKLGEPTEWHASNESTQIWFLLSLIELFRRVNDRVHILFGLPATRQ